MFGAPGGGPGITKLGVGIYPVVGAPNIIPFIIVGRAVAVFFKGRDGEETTTVGSEEVELESRLGSGSGFLDRRVVTRAESNLASWVSEIEGCSVIPKELVSSL